MNRPLRWAAGVAALSIAAVVASSVMPLVGAILAALTAPGIVIATHEILKATDGLAVAETPRAVFVAVALLALSVVVILWFAFYVPATG